jgi:shikimate kinase
LADVWGCSFLDTDDVVATKAGTSAPTYLREHGEAAFRVQELAALRGALRTDGVVATGAGVVSTSAARDLLRGERTFWIDSDDETLLERVSEGERPLLGDDHRGALANLREQREGWYRTSARFRVDSSGTLDEVVRRILEQVEGETL